MSAPDQYVQLIVPLSTVPGVSVTEGAINLFAMDETGRRWPFLTVQGPTLIIGPTAGQVEITAVAHGTAAMATLSSDPSPQDRQSPEFKCGRSDARLQEAPSVPLPLLGG